MPDENMPLVDLLTALRDQIDESRARLQQAGKEAMFIIGKAEVEIHFTVEKTKEGSGGINWHFLALGAKAESRRENVHTLKVELQPAGRIAAAGARDRRPPR